MNESDINLCTYSHTHTRIQSLCFNWFTSSSWTKSMPSVCGQVHHYGKWQVGTFLPNKFVALKVACRKGHFGTWFRSNDVFCFSNTCFVEKVNNQSCIIKLINVSCSSLNKACYFVYVYKLQQWGSFGNHVSHCFFSFIVLIVQSSNRIKHFEMSTTASKHNADELSIKQAEIGRKGPKNRTHCGGFREGTQTDI